VLHEALERARRLRAIEGKLPHVTGEDGRWLYLSPLAPEPEALTGLPWTGGFVAGQLRLAGEADAADEIDALLAPRADQATTHDLGFLFWTASDELRRRAARTLVRRALPAGVIQVSGSLDDAAWRGQTIIDTWPNLRLLWSTGNEAAARAHLEATVEVLLRPDGSTFHAARIADDGSVLERGTINGAADDSTWARGQAWAILGLAGATGFREEAERAARWFLDHLPEDGIPPWDFSAREPKDASAAAIAASALFELGWEQDARRLVDALQPCLNRGGGDGILVHCAYRPKQGVGLGCATAWGDFFFLEALLKGAGYTGVPRRRTNRGGSV
jgi:unsaturated chondroitin disaccharide hydrolase